MAGGAHLRAVLLGAAVAARVGMSYQSIRRTLCAIPHIVTHHDGQVIFENDSGFYNTYGRFAFCYLETYDRWDLIDEDQSHGGVMIEHLEAAFEILRMDFPKGELKECPRPEFIFQAKGLDDMVKSHDKECRCRLCRSCARFQYDRYDKRRRHVYIRLGRGFDVWWEGLIPKFWRWRRCQHRPIGG